MCSVPADASTYWHYRIFFHFEARNLGIFGTLNEVIPLTESGFADSFANLMLDDGKGAELHFAQKWAQN